MISTVSSDQLEAVQTLNVRNDLIMKQFSKKFRGRLNREICSKVLTTNILQGTKFVRFYHMCQDRSHSAGQKKRYDYCFI